MSETTSGFTTDLVDGLTESEWHRLLAHEQRRVALDVLTEETVPSDLEGLAAEIVARADGQESENERVLARVRTTLHHTHLPKMDDFGVLSYDPETHRVTQCPLSGDSKGGSVRR